MSTGVPLATQSGSRLPALITRSAKSSSPRSFPTYPSTHDAKSSSVFKFSPSRRFRAGMSARFW